jgi:TonB family protein
MSALLLRDIVSFAIQLAAIVGAGAAMWRLLRVRHSTVSLNFWRLLLLACLLLPALQPWRAATLPSPVPTNFVAVSSAAAVAAANPTLPAAVGSAWSWNEIALACLLAGVVARALWLAIGAGHLRRLRQSAVRVDPVPAIVREVEALIGVGADVYVSDRIAGPITFGVWRPVVIVPPSVLDMDAALQEAIVAHELLHVRRRDWLSVIGEEVIRSVFWFHPAMWWLISRIQLSREHVVDETVIRLTASRDAYVEALLAVARAPMPAVPAPAPFFLRRHLLKKRVAQILQETTMTTRQLIASASISAVAVMAAAALVTRSFPLEAHTPPQEKRAIAVTSGDPVQIVRGGENLLHGSRPEYPKRAIERRVSGLVVVDVSVDDSGEVSDARVTSGPDELRRATLEAVLGWHFSPGAARGTTQQVEVQFNVPTLEAESRERREVRVLEGRAERARQELDLAAGSEDRAKNQIRELERAFNEANTAEQKEELKRAIEELRLQLARVVERREVHRDAQLVRIASERVEQPIIQTIMQQAGVSIGDMITEEALKRIRDAAMSVDQHISVRLMIDRRSGGLILTLIAP